MEINNFKLALVNGRCLDGSILTLLFENLIYINKTQIYNNTQESLKNLEKYD